MRTRPNLVVLDFDLAVARSLEELSPPGVPVSGVAITQLSNVATILKLRFGRNTPAIYMAPLAYWNFPFPVDDGIYLENPAQAGYTAQVVLSLAGDDA
jgi:hypothetical protein